MFTLPAAPFTVDAPPGSLAWRQMLSASRVAAACGVSPYLSRSELVREQYGKPQRNAGQNPAIAWGVANEQNALQALNRFYAPSYLGGFGVANPFTFCRQDMPNLLATPDFFLETDDEVLGGEIKCPYNQGIPHESVPAFYMPQVQTCMYVTGLTSWLFVSWTPNAFTVFRVAFSPAYWERILFWLREFLSLTQDNVDDNGLPDPKALHFKRGDGLRRQVEHNRLMSDIDIVHLFRHGH